MWIQRLFWPTIFWNGIAAWNIMECSFQLSLWQTWIVCYPSHLQSRTHWCCVWGMLSIKCLRLRWNPWGMLKPTVPSYTIQGIIRHYFTAYVLYACDAWWCLSLIHGLFGTQEILKRNAALATCRTLLLLQGTSHWMEVLKLRRATTTYQGRSWG